MKKPDDFNLRRAITGHGWYVLPPFRSNDDTSELQAVIPLSKSNHVIGRISEVNSSIKISVMNRSALSTTHSKHIRTTVRSILRMDESFDEFYSLCRKEPHLRWVPRAKAGRLLRSPTVFEDVIKMIFTTNCSWALTKIMTFNLTTKLGTEVQKGIFSFPGPDVIADKSERWLRKEISCGYRAPYIRELCRNLSKKKIELESLRHSTVPTDELYGILRSIKGIGHYAAGNLLKLLGRYDYLGIDSWIRRSFSDMHKNGRKVSDAAIEKHYDRYGKWRGLVCWMEAMSD